MARKTLDVVIHVSPDGDNPDPLPIGNADEPRYLATGHVGRFSPGDEVTAADLFPGEADPAVIAAQVRRLFGLSVLSPIDPGPAPPVPTPETIAPIKVAVADRQELGIDPEPVPIPPKPAGLPPLHFPTPAPKPKPDEPK